MDVDEIEPLHRHVGGEFVSYFYRGLAHKRDGTAIYRLIREEATNTLSKDREGTFALYGERCPKECH